MRIWGWCWAVWLLLVCCFGGARRRTRHICLSTPWCRTPPTACCCATGLSNSTHASPVRWKVSFKNLSDFLPHPLNKHRPHYKLILIFTRRITRQPRACYFVLVGGGGRCPAPTSQACRACPKPLAHGKAAL